MAKLIAHTFLILLLIFMLTGCGSSDANIVSLPPPPENNALILSAKLNVPVGQTSTSVAIKQIDVSFDLPAGMTPILETDGITLKVNETGLKNLNGKGVIWTGSYNSLTKSVLFSIMASDTINGDLGKPNGIAVAKFDIARLTYQTDSQLVQPPPAISPVYKVYGPIVNNNSTEISAEILPDVSLVTYQKP